MTWGFRHSLTAELITLAGNNTLQDLVMRCRVVALAFFLAVSAPA